ncbi:MAG TPA: hypothetical protein VMI33_15135 [Streptosporangiaceae bacterium]|nr:hypothetical protein [Streptosporangiaceae bacterium]
MEQPTEGLGPRPSDPDAFPAGPEEVPPAGGDGGVGEGEQPGRAEGHLGGPEEYADGDDAGGGEYADAGTEDDARAGQYGQYVSAGPDDDVGPDEYPGGADDDAGDGAQEQGGRGEREPHAERRLATGEPRVDAALARLDDLAGRPVAEHRAIFEDVHRRLRDVLGELDARQPLAPGPKDAASRPGR